MYRPGGVVIMGSQLLKLPMQYCCAWGMWNISSYAINQIKISKIFKNIHILLGLGLGAYHVRLRNYVVNKDRERNDPQTHNHCHSYFSHISLSLSLCSCLFHRIFGAIRTVLGSSFLSLPSPGPALTHVSSNQNWDLRYFKRKSGFLIKRQKEKLSFLFQHDCIQSDPFIIFFFPFSFRICNNEFSLILFILFFLPFLLFKICISSRCTSMHS